MTQARLREERQQLIAQAALMWDEGTLDLDSYVQTGSFGDTSNVMDYDADVRALVVKQFQGK